MDKIATQVKAKIAQLQPSLSGKIAYYLLPFRRKVMFKNFAIVFKDSLSKLEKKRLAQAVYAHILLSLWENLCLSFSSPKKLSRYVTVKGKEHLLNTAQHKKGAIIITGHLGNWEFAPVVAMTNFTQYQGRLYFIRKLLKNKFLEKLLFGRYLASGLGVIPKKNAMQTACSELEANNAIIFVIDQHASINKRDGIRCEFFGKACGTYRAPALLAEYMQTPVLPARAYRTQEGRHVLEFFPPLQWQEGNTHKESQYLNTLQYNQWIEKFIVEYPEQWLWLHKRWKI